MALVTFDDEAMGTSFATQKWQGKFPKSKCLGRRTYWSSARQAVEFLDLFRAPYAKCVSPA